MHGDAGIGDPFRRQAHRRHKGDAFASPDQGEDGRKARLLDSWAGLRSVAGAIDLAGVIDLVPQAMTVRKQKQITGFDLRHIDYLLVGQGMAVGHRDPERFVIKHGLADVLAVLETLRADFNRVSGGDKKVSLADVIVLGGCEALEEAARKAGHAVKVPFTPARADATAEQTEIASIAHLEPRADGFRNYLAPGSRRSPQELLVDRAQLLILSATEMTVLVGGLRVLGTNHCGTQHGVFSAMPGLLTNDFFVNLLDMRTTWSKSTDDDGIYEGRDTSGNVVRTATAVDLVFGSNSQLRALAEVYAESDA